MKDDLVRQLIGRAKFCFHRGEVKTPALLTEAADRITALEAQLATARRDALEEAAKVAEAYEPSDWLNNAGDGTIIAQAIRTLMDKTDAE